ncbi:MAG: putative transcriptional regulator [Anaerocolumna sp.]|jgi:LysR family hydrogen peroxide-inducible transcriptional activator|nr:putative transcriptional regulator [Anaerocolumna sp.]
MEKHQLLYVITASKYSNFTKAANELNISQPSLSNQIIKLENELNIKLFERRSHDVILTPAGQDFVKYAKIILNDFDNLSNLMNDHSRFKKGSIRIGALSIMIPLGILKLIGEFQNLYPGIEIKLIEGGSATLLSLLKTHEIDIAFIILSEEMLIDVYLDMKFDKIIEDRIMAIVSKKHLLSNSNKIHIKELINEKLIISSSGFNLHNIILNLFYRNNINPNISCECNQIYNCIQLANEGLGITFASEKVAKFYSFENLTTIPIEPELKRSVYLVSPSNLTYLPIVNKFKNFILEKYDLL